MDKEEMLKKHNYTNKKSFFKKYDVLIEIIALFTIAIGMFYLGTSIFVLSKSNNTDKTKTSETTNQIVDSKESQEKKDETNDANSSIDSDNQKDPSGTKETTTTNPTSKTIKFSIKSALGEIIYSKEYAVGESFAINNVAPGTYYLSGTTDKSLFTTQTANNEVKCVVADPITESSCTVSEIQTPSTTPPAPTN